MEPKGELCIDDDHVVDEGHDTVDEGRSTADEGRNTIEGHDAIEEGCDVVDEGRDVKDGDGILASIVTISLVAFPGKRVS